MRKHHTQIRMGSILLSLMIIFGFVSFPYVVNATDEASFSLIEYVSSHDIHSQAEFEAVIQQHCNQYYQPMVIENEVFFQIEIEYENSLVSTLVVEDLGQTRGEKTGRATKNYYSDTGEIVFTIVIEGRFRYSSTEVRTLSASGSYSKPPLSLWNSTPTISSGNVTSNYAYALIYGTATSIYGSQNYSLAVACDKSGNITGV